jgi:hypothetical protein
VIFVYFNSSRFIKPAHETCGSSRAVMTRRWELVLRGHVAVSELPQDLVVGARAMRYVAAPELS